MFGMWLVVFMKWAAVFRSWMHDFMLCWLNVGRLPRWRRCGNVRGSHESVIVQRRSWWVVVSEPEWGLVVLLSRHCRDRSICHALNGQCGSGGRGGGRRSVIRVSGLSLPPFYRVPHSGCGYKFKDGWTMADALLLHSFQLRGRPDAVCCVLYQVQILGHHGSRHYERSPTPRPTQTRPHFQHLKQPDVVSGHVHFDQERGQ